jgi:2-methylisocitrate lyase-like PEP mutase family enzyme
MNNIRDARFYVIDESDGYLAGEARPLGFDEAIERAEALVNGGRPVKVLYTEEASQTEITRFVSQGVPTELVSGA